jgi:hypothetical protein
VTASQGTDGAAHAPLIDRPGPEVAVVDRVAWQTDADLFVSATPSAPDEQASVRGGGRSTSSALVGKSLLILSGLLLGFVLCITVVGGLYYRRAQTDGYAGFRSELALAEAPVGQLDYDGRPVLVGAPMALLSIPALHLQVLVRDGTTPGVLTGGPGLERDTVLPGQVGTSVVFGRRWTFGGPFGGLGQLRPGDAILVTTGQGTTQFRVIDVRLAGERVPAGPAAGRGRLVLVTAGGSPWQPSTALWVDADTVAAGRPVGPVVPAAMLAPTEKILATDSSARVPVLLWSALLALAALLITWLRKRWAGPQLWVAAVPVILVIGLELANEAARLLPNLM